MSKDPLDIDGLGAIWLVSALWVAALVAQIVGWVNWNQNVLISGVVIGGLAISFLTHRRHRRRQH